MTKVICDIGRDIFFDCDGHSNYRNPNTQNNDVCVMTSSLCSFLSIYLQEKGIEPKAFEDGKVTYIIENCKDEAVRDVFKTIMDTFKFYQNQYEGYIKIY